jgi:hypothetical protein
MDGRKTGKEYTVLLRSNKIRYGCCPNRKCAKQRTNKKSKIQSTSRHPTPHPHPQVPPLAFGDMRLPQSESEQETFLLLREEKERIRRYNLPSVRSCCLKLPFSVCTRLISSNNASFCAWSLSDTAPTARNSSCAAAASCASCNARADNSAFAFVSSRSVSACSAARCSSASFSASSCSTFPSLSKKKKKKKNTTRLTRHPENWNEKKKK